MLRCSCLGPAEPREFAFFDAVLPRTGLPGPGTRFSIRGPVSSALAFWRVGSLSRIQRRRESSARIRSVFKSCVFMRLLEFRALHVQTHCPGAELSCDPRLEGANAFKVIGRSSTGRPRKRATIGHGRCDQCPGWPEAGVRLRWLHASLRAPSYASAANREPPRRLYSAKIVRWAIARLRCANSLPRRLNEHFRRTIVFCFDGASRFSRSHSPWNMFATISETLTSRPRAPHATAGVGAVAAPVEFSSKSSLSAAGGILLGRLA